MMGRILLSLMCLAGWKAVSCLPRQYHYIANPMTWTEAQTYCRQKHTDLASVQSSEEMSQLLSSVSPNTASAVWIGLYTEIKWKWSDGFKGNGADYRRWDNEREPNFYEGKDQFCINVGPDGGWWDDGCFIKYPSVCYKGTQQDPVLVLVPDLLDWHGAQKHCRKKYVDLANVRNDNENEYVAEQVPSHTWAWIGLHRDPNFFWSDGSVGTFMIWDSVSNPLRNLSRACVAANLENSGKWRLVSCELRLPFVCHSQASHQQVIKLRMKVEDSSVDLNDPAIKTDILKKIQDKVKESGSSGLTLKWREQPDSKVFHKEKESPRMKKRGKTEF